VRLWDFLNYFLKEFPKIPKVETLFVYIFLIITSNASLSALQQMQVLNTDYHISASNLNLSMYKEIHDYCSDEPFYLFMILFGNTTPTANTVISAGSKYLPHYFCTVKLHFDDSQRVTSSWKASKHHHVNLMGSK